MKKIEHKDSKIIKCTSYEYSKNGVYLCKLPSSNIDDK